MQNEFEKQVKEKMEELNFTPSEPVWQNIEMKIRDKKDRRRILLWIPLLFALLGGGIVWLNYGTGEKHSSFIIKKVKNKNQAQEYSSNNQNTDLNTFQKNEIKNNIGIKDKNKNQSVEINKSVPDLLKTVPDKIVFSGNNRQIQKQIPSGKKAGIKNGQISKGFLVTGMNDFYSSSTIGLDNIKKRNNTSFDKLLTIYIAVFENNKEKRESIVPEQKSLIKADSLLKEIQKLQKKNNNWKFGFIVSAGYSGTNNQKDASKSTLSSISYPLILQPLLVNSSTSVKIGSAFSIGLAAHRKLGKRLTISTGLQYNYYSTIINLGQTVRQDTIINQTSVNVFYRDPSMTSFGNNTGSYSMNNSKYSSQYHHISIPIAIDVQVINKLPLFIHASLSFHQLIHTNALNNNGQVYYKDMAAFTKAQLFSGLGINYSILKNSKRSLLLGPQFEYGLSAVQKNNSGHLYSLGIIANYLFLKSK